MNVLVLEAPSTAEWGEDFDPIPVLAAAYGMSPETEYKLALPNGNGGYCATFEIDHVCMVDGVLARFGDMQPTKLMLSRVGGYQLRPDDLLEVVVHIHRRQ